MVFSRRDVLHAAIGNNLSQVTSEQVVHRDLLVLFPDHLDRHQRSQDAGAMEKELAVTAAIEVEVTVGFQFTLQLPLLNAGLGLPAPSSSLIELQVLPERSRWNHFAPDGLDVLQVARIYVEHHPAVMTDHAAHTFHCLVLYQRHADRSNAMQLKEAVEEHVQPADKPARVDRIDNVETGRQLLHLDPVIRPELTPENI